MMIKFILKEIFFREAMVATFASQLFQATQKFCCECVQEVVSFSDIDGHLIIRNITPLMHNQKALYDMN